MQARTETRSPLSPARTRARAGGLLPVFFRPRAIARFLRDKRASLSSKILFFTAIAYVLMPIDLVPDLAPLLGWLDDLGIATAAFGWIAHRISAYDKAVPELEDSPVIDVGASRED